MPNIALIFKNEIMRLARKEVKRATGSIYASVKDVKQQNSALKKRVAELERQLMVLQGKTAAAFGTPAAAESETPHTRLGASSIRKLRSRLNLNRHDMALLLDVNQNSIFLWEQAKAKPRAATRAKIIALRTMKKNAVAALLIEKKGKAAPAESVKKEPAVPVAAAKPAKRGYRSAVEKKAPESVKDQAVKTVKTPKSKVRKVSRSKTTKMPKKTVIKPLEVVKASEEKSAPNAPQA